MTSSSISTLLGIEPVNPREFEIRSACAPTNVREYCLTLVTRPGESLVKLFKDAPADIVVIAPLALRSEAASLPQVFFFTERPRLAFCKAGNCLERKQRAAHIDTTAFIGPDVVLGAGVGIGRWCVLDGVIEVGAGTQIEDHTVIKGPAVIGSRVHIKPGCVIGTRGFGFERDENSVPIVFPHFGKVIIGDDVELGANSTVARGSLNDTIIGHHVKIDERVHVGHNAQVGKGSMIASGVVLCGSVRIGNDVWIGPNATISDSLEVGDGAHIGISSVVTMSVPPQTTVAARPAMLLGRRA